MSSAFAIQRTAFAASAAGLSASANALNNNANNNPRIDGWAGV
ncbi:hypothetical protein [Dyella sp. 2RAB6]